MDSYACGAGHLGNAGASSSTISLTRWGQAGSQQRGNVMTLPKLTTYTLKTLTEGRLMQMDVLPGRCVPEGPLTRVTGPEWVSTST